MTVAFGRPITLLLVFEIHTIQGTCTFDVPFLACPRKGTKRRTPAERIIGNSLDHLLIFPNDLCSFFCSSKRMNQENDAPVNDQSGFRLAQVMRPNSFASSARQTGGRFFSSIRSAHLDLLRSKGNGKVRMTKLFNGVFT